MNALVFKKDRDGLTLQVRQSRDPLNNHYLEHFEKSKIHKGKSAANFLGWPPKINHGT